MLFGVLNAKTQYLKADATAGVRLAMVNIGWDNWEPERGAMNSSYVAQQLAIVREYERAGWRVAVDLGLEFPPAWAVADPGDQLVDQNGNRSGTPNFEFSQSVRHSANAFIQDAVRTLPGIDYYRIGLSQYGEMLYPASPEGQWWAFDGNAQEERNGLPRGMTASPMRGWVPGTPQWRGLAVTRAMVESWYAWYLGALVNAEKWEISSIRRAGYSGDLQYVIPGIGVLPDYYDVEMENQLSDVDWDPYHTINTGAVWWKLLDELPTTRAVVDISSVGDGSGAAGAKRCQASDATVDDRDAQVDTWSDTRWLTHLARQHGLGVMGENPGSSSEESLETIMGLVRACGLVALQWAWDSPLNLGTSSITLPAYGQAIRYQRRVERDQLREVEPAPAGS